MESELRGLSVRQPWAWAICHGKDVENRSRGTRHRGLLAIHASKSAPYAADLADPNIVDAIEANGFRVDDPPSAQGAIVAVAVLASCHYEGTERPRNSCSPWGQPDMYHWDLADVRPLPEPVPCKGALGLWRLPEDVEKAVRAQLEDGNPDAGTEPRSAEARSGSSWEDRMAARAAERAARRAAAEAAEREAAREARGYDDTGLPGHEGHHMHMDGNGLICSCGQAFGCFSFVPDPRCWSADPSEVAQLEREEADWHAWIRCWICGMPGVTAQDVSWPPRTLPG